MKINPILLVVLALVCLTVANAATQSLEIVSYNAENLFDTEHDEGKNDWEFLPKSYPGKVENCEKYNSGTFKKKCIDTDWTEQKLGLKLNQIRKVFSLRPQLPDIAGFVEVENENVMRQLAETLGYPEYIITNGPDERGIDVGLVYRPSAQLKFVSKKEYPLKGEDFAKNPTRNFLEVEFLVGTARLFVYVNHWPSQAAPTAVRLEVARQFKEIVDARLVKDAYVVALGDFNVIAEERPDPLFDGLNGSLQDVDRLFWEMHKKKGDELQVHDKRPPGTYFFPNTMSWNLLDHFMVSGNLLAKRELSLDLASYEIVAPDAICNSYKYTRPGFTEGTLIKRIPYRYDHNAATEDKAGFSDHFPIAMKLNVN